MIDNGESTESVEIERPATDLETSVETPSPTKSTKDPTTVSLASTDDYVQLDYDDSNIEALNENGLSDTISTSLVTNEEILSNADEVPSSTIPAVDELEELPDDEECSVAIGSENCDDNNENASILDKANEIKETNSCMSSEEVVLEVNDIEVKSEPMGELNEPTESKPDRDAQAHKPDEDEKATEAGQAGDREKEEKRSRKRRAEVPRAYQLPPRKKHDETESRIVTKRKRSLPVDESIEARLARNRRLRMQRILAARRQRITEMSRADARFRRSPLPSSSRYHSNRRNSDRLRYPSRRSPVSFRRGSPVPLVRLRDSAQPKRRFSPRRNNDNRRYESSSRRSRSPATSHGRGSNTPARRYDGAGPSRPAFVGNDQYRIYIRSETERRPARRERTPPRYRRTPPGSSRSRHEPMRMERRNSRNGGSIPSLLSIKTAPPVPPPASRRRHDRSPPQSFYVRGDEDDRRRPSSRSHWRRTPRERSPR